MHATVQRRYSVTSSPLWGLVGTARRSTASFPIVDESLEEPLVEGELARFVVVASGDSVCVRAERRCSPKRAVADCASKIAFFLRRRAGGGLRFNDLWVRSAGPANESFMLSN